MSTWSRLGIFAISLTAVISLMVGLVVSVQLRHTRHDLSATRTKLAAVVGVNDSSPASIKKLELDEQTISDDLLALRKRDACPPSNAIAYYERLLGAEQTGTDETTAESLLTTICPQVQTDSP